MVRDIVFSVGISFLDEYTRRVPVVRLLLLYVAASVLRCGF